jgi:predicted RNase H-like nuclease (RuvC/YqgF family)
VSFALNSNARAIALPVQSSQDARQILEACREATAEVEFLRKKVAAMDKLDSERKGLIEILEQRIALLQKSVDQYKAALATGEKIESVDSRLIQSYEQSLKDAKAEIEKQRAKASFWRKFASLGVVGALLIGGAFGVLLGAK